MRELMISDTGDLINCDNWAVVREHYQHHYRDITTPSELASTIRAAIRTGGHVWPGGYAVFFITSGGGVICHSCAIAEYWNIVDSMRRDISDGWRIVGAGYSPDIDDEINCDHCNGEIE